MMIATLGVVSCSDDNYDTHTGNENEGGLLTYKKSTLAYVVGNGNDFEYTADISVFQGEVQTLSVDVYKKFTNTDGVSSETVLLKSFTFPNVNQVENTSFTFTYDELRNGLTVNGAGLPDDDSNLNIGDYWELIFVSHTSNDKLHENAQRIKVAVGTRFAGTYKCISGFYYRIGVLTYTEADWPAETIVESVNSTTYRVKKYFGPFENTSTATGGDYYFTIDSNDIIGYPATTPDGVAQQGNAQPFITCLTNPGDMSDVNCGNSNFVIRDDVNGKDQLVMSFGYYTPGSGPRTFYQVMEKIVD